MMLAGYYLVLMCDQITNRFVVAVYTFYPELREMHILFRLVARHKED